MKKLILMIAVTLLMVGCDTPPQPATPVSSSGASKVNIQVPKNMNGHTIEQENIAERIKQDNAPGSIKHLYVISAYSGQVIIYSTVRGKVTSGSKRLTPQTVHSGYNGAGMYGIPIDIGGQTHYTGEVLGDDGTYGSSGDYLYWWDTKGELHQHYISGGQIVHISTQPLAVKGIIINMEARDSSGQ